jgi:hypothetical protein
MTRGELQAMRSFDAELLRLTQRKRSVPDVPDALADAMWHTIMAAAGELLRALAPAADP